MSETASENVPAPAAPVSENAESQSWPVLAEHERRVLGVLVEKAKTTPDAYPLSLNALATGCNQKSNRDPILNLADFEVEDSLTGLQKLHLVGKIVGGRVERWRHLLYETWRVSKVELAVLAELMLRGPQTEGDLRVRASRMEPIDDLDALRSVLHSLHERGLIVYLTPEGRRGTTLTHGFHEPAELEDLRGPADAEPLNAKRAPSAPPEAPSALETQLREARAEIDVLRRHVTDLQTQYADLAAQVKNLQEALGV